MVLGDIIYAYVKARPDTYYDVEELSRFYDKPYEFHYTSIKKDIRYLIQDPEKDIIWWRKYPVE